MYFYLKFGDGLVFLEISIKLFFLFLNHTLKIWWILKDNCSCVNTYICVHLSPSDWIKRSCMKKTGDLILVKVDQRLLVHTTNLQSIYLQKKNYKKALNLNKNVLQQQKFK